MKKKITMSRYFMHSKIRSAQLFSALAMFVFGAVCEAGTTFYTDEAAFIAATPNTTLSDFEGIVADDAKTNSLNLVVDGVTYTAAGNFPNQ